MLPKMFFFFFFYFLYPAKQKVAGYYVIPSESFEGPSVRLYARPFVRPCPSVSASFPDSNVSSF